MKSFSIQHPFELISKQVSNSRTFNLRVILIALTLSFSQVSFSEPLDPLCESSNTTGTWTLIQTISGVDILYQENITNSITYLTIKFVNTTNSPINFQWSVDQNNTSLISNKPETLSANATVIIDQSSSEYDMLSEQTISSLSITLTII